MTYRVNRALGHQKWGVTNPWVFANYGQPQRHRGYVSPMVFQTTGPYLKSAHLGASDLDASPAEAELLRQAEADIQRGERMEKIAWAGLAISSLSLLMAYRFYSRQERRSVRANRRRRRRRTSRR